MGGEGKTCLDFLEFVKIKTTSQVQTQPKHDFDPMNHAKQGKEVKQARNGLMCLDP